MECSGSFQLDWWGDDSLYLPSPPIIDWTAPFMTMMRSWNAFCGGGVGC